MKRPYRLTATWHDGTKRVSSFPTRKAAEDAKAEAEGLAAAMRDGTWLIATANGLPVEPKPGEVVECDAERGCWVRKLPAAKVTCRITKRAES